MDKAFSQYQEHQYNDEMRHFFNYLFLLLLIFANEARGQEYDLVPNKTSQTYGFDVREQDKIIEEFGKYYVLVFRPSGKVHFKIAIELYFAVGTRYEENFETGERVPVHYLFPAIRYHGLGHEFDESGNQVVKKYWYKHGILRRTRMLN